MRIACVQAEIQIEYLPNMNLQFHRYINVVSANTVGYVV
jgi:hypothetical protein